MPIVHAAKAALQIVGGTVVLTIRVDGRPRRLTFSPQDALLVGNQLANAGADILPTNPGLPRIESIRIRPFDADGQALLQLTSPDFDGPATFTIDHHWLRALASGADAALEFARPGGRA